MNNKTLKELRSKIDWNLQSRKPYVVVDPFAPDCLLYMTDKEYLLFVRTCIRTDVTVSVIFRPGDNKPDEGDNTPQYVAK